MLRTTPQASISSGSVAGRRHPENRGCRLAKKSPCNRALQKGDRRFRTDASPVGKPPGRCWPAKSNSLVSSRRAEECQRAGSGWTASDPRRIRPAGTDVHGAETPVSGLPQLASSENPSSLRGPLRAGRQFLLSLSSPTEFLARFLGRLPRGSPQPAGSARRISGGILPAGHASLPPGNTQQNAICCKIRLPIINYKILNLRSFQENLISHGHFAIIRKIS